MTEEQRNREHQKNLSKALRLPNLVKISQTINDRIKSIDETASSSGDSKNRYSVSLSYDEAKIVQVLLENIRVHIFIEPY